MVEIEGRVLMAMGQTMRTVLVTGSSGLIGSEAVLHFERRGNRVLGIDNNMRADFFGPQGDTVWNLQRLRGLTRRFEHFSIDIRDRQAVLDFFREHRPDAVIHCAAQPSHDLAKDRPFDDFDVNAGGTLNLLEATRRHATDSPFIFMSTNKVYGDAPNELPLVELERRYDYALPEDYGGIPETCRIDRSLHSLFGASKAAADVLTQEFGRYFNMPTVCFRGGCLTGPQHSGVELHGFLSYLVKVAVSGETYRIFGYKGKQVRDQIHSEDVVGAMEAFIEAPRAGEVYNLGGGRESNASLLECMDMIETRLGWRVATEYQEQNRAGDHICYISDTAKLKRHFPGWRLKHTIDDIVAELVAAELERLPAARGLTRTARTI
jgi:CDP-paratose 2-epimerase